MITARIKAWNSKVIDDLKPVNKTDYFLLIVSLALLIYTIVFALTSDITYDEAYTYMYYSTKSKPNFLAFDLANNHPLNSLLIYFSSFLFPYREFFIRLPNILFLILYLVYAIRISKSKAFSSIKVLTFSFLALYHFLIPDFFSQARGYGMASCLVLIFLHHFIQNDQSFKNITKSFYILFLATFAFTGLIPLVVAVSIYYLFFEIKFKAFAFIQKTFIDIFLLLLGYLWLLYNLFVTTSAEKPLYGSEEPFAVATLGYYLNSFSDFIPTVGQLSLQLFYAIIILVFLFFFIKKPKSTKITFITLLTFLLFFIGSKISNRPNITGRILLPLFPLVVLSFSELFLLVIKQLKISKKYVLVFSSVIVGFMCLNFFYKAYQTDPSTVRGNFQKEIFENLNLNVTANEWTAAIPFYLNKFKNYPPKENPLFSEIVLTEEIKCFYSFEKGVLVLEASKKIDINKPFFLRIFPENQEDLPKDRVEDGFENDDFSWKSIKKIGESYEVKTLPNYAIKHIIIGQFDETGEKWAKKVTNNE